VVDPEVTQAVACVRRATAAVGRTNFSTGISAYPLAAVDFDKRSAIAPAFAPLLFLCLDHTLIEGMAWYLAMTHSSLSRKRSKAPVDLYPEDEGTALMERANTFLRIEAELWAEACVGGYRRPVPYAVRYESARYLWSPRIVGTAFCLRCGEVIRYQRRGRQTDPQSDGESDGQSDKQCEKGTRKVPLCGRCIRAENLNWPTNALAPDTRRTWWLRCVKCGALFTGGGNRKLCDEHRRRQGVP
jgi:hypothetical protein